MASGALPADLRTLFIDSVHQEGWEPWHYGVVLVGAWTSLMWFEHGYQWCRSIWREGKPFSFAEIQPAGACLTDEMLNYKDYLWTGINSFLISPVYTLHTLAYLRVAAGIEWSLVPHLSLPLQLFLMFLIYDAIYAPVHRFLHLPSIYAWVHKHHHRQCAPFRGTFDGLNVHPLEYLFGSYLHLVTLHLVKLLLPCIGLSMHLATPALFTTMSLLMASLNHTRHDVRVLECFGFFDVRAHHVHHGWPRSNYSQFTTWWDRVTSCYIPFEQFESRRK